MHAAVHLERLESLWRLLVRGDLSEAHVIDVLEEAAYVLEPEQHFSAFLGHLDGATWSLDTKVLRSAGELEAFGNPFDASLGKRMSESGHAAQWDDSIFGCAIGSRFRVGLQTHVLLFAAKAPPARDYTRSDLTLVELLASFLGMLLRERAQQSALLFRSTHDDLTGMLNRRGLIDGINARLLEPAPRLFTLLVFDLDQYGRVNEALGNDVGDAILQAAARRLSAFAPPSSIVGRLSGDSFAVVLDDVEQKSVIAFVDAVREKIAEPTSLGTEVVRLTASAGAALFPADGSDAQALLVHADAAIKSAKRNGRDRFEMFSAQAEASMLRSRSLRAELIRAFDEDEFSLVFQPKLDLKTGSVAGAEALIRWNHPAHGIVMPNDFILFAEETGLIDRIDSIVMGQAMRYARRFAERTPGFRLFFNLSAAHLSRRDFGAEFAQLREYHAVAPENLGIELTETAMLRDPAVALANVRRLRESGVEVALDDFGTGNSSFAIVRLLPVDVVKIGAPFTLGLPDDPDDAAIVQTLIVFAHRMRCSVTVEQIETEGQLEWLRGHGSDHAQGYYIAEPMSEEDFLAWLERGA